jgi:hypothetical protein
VNVVSVPLQYASTGGRFKLVNLPPVAFVTVPSARAGAAPRIGREQLAIVGVVVALLESERQPSMSAGSASDRGSDKGDIEATPFRTSAPGPPDDLIADIIFPIWK